MSHNFCTWGSTYYSHPSRLSSCGSGRISFHLRIPFEHTSSHPDIVILMSVTKMSKINHLAGTN
ncbi:hypothetical protein I7I48_00604 [Histoplasma ohiense]|nr:hypothetical protein I7I48_00604 [Histoplasma ohiense (nom. inval.)]